MAFCLLIIWISLLDCNLLAWVGGERPVWRCVGDYRRALCPRRRAQVMMCKGNAGLQEGKSAEWLWSRRVGAVMGPSQADGSTDYLILWLLGGSWNQPDYNLILMTTLLWTLPSCCGSLACSCYRSTWWCYFSFTWNSRNKRERGRESDSTWKKLPLTCAVFTVFMSGTYSAHTDIKTVV